MKLSTYTTRSARSSGAVGPQAILPRYLAQIKPEGEILDYGAGPGAIHTLMLRRYRLKVTAYDVPENQRPGLHDPEALKRPWRTVFASNVLNVQRSPRGVAEVVYELAHLLAPGGQLFVNYPLDPNYPELGTAGILRILEDHFSQVTRIADPIVGKNRVWQCRHPR